MCKSFVIEFETHENTRIHAIIPLRAFWEGVVMHLADYALDFETRSYKIAITKLFLWNQNRSWLFIIDRKCVLIENANSPKADSHPAKLHERIPARAQTHCPKEVL